MKIKNSRQLSDLGEFGFIARLAAAVNHHLPENVTGIGDDCAVVPWEGNRNLLVTTDLLLDGVHFLKQKISARDLGYKSLAVNLSDIAAMGGKPLWAFLSIALPAETKVSWVDQFLSGWKSLSQKTGVKLLGGDTSKTSGAMVINVALLGEAQEKYIKYRSTARTGEVVAVTGELGSSEGGLRLILNERLENLTGKDEKYLLRRHFHPQPCLREGFFLAHQPEVGAMMDVSDGIDSDLKRIMERSDRGAEVYLEELPVSASLKRCSRKYGWHLEEAAIGGGEDYCLLLTVRSENFQRLNERYSLKFGRRLYPIGRMTEKKGILTYLKNGQPVSFRRLGFDHFRS
ncbi:MAG: thiamine-phosphate kinase [Acidobacteriota bacterium]|nr:thiamine-phosphate kinase [Acidobacteriota bacterium]